jgi:predicted adenylyl cyclase CyaB
VSNSLNLELKARDPAPERSVQVCEELGAESGGVLRQRDVYFNVPRGRLKLRSQNDGIGQLIAYERPDRPGVRPSAYRIVSVPDAGELEAALTETLGVVAEVRKMRRLFLHDGVRIHLDSVEGLGRFIELEAVVGGDDRGSRERILEELRLALEVKAADLVGGSYCDLRARSGLL